MFYNLSSVIFDLDNSNVPYKVNEIVHLAITVIGNMKSDLEAYSQTSLEVCVIVNIEKFVNALTWYLTLTSLNTYFYEDFELFISETVFPRFMQYLTKTNITDNKFLAKFFKQRLEKLLHSKKCKKAQKKYLKTLQIR